ncbi:response regulator [Luteimonas sp. RIT-PG2_3]
MPKPESGADAASQRWRVLIVDDSVVDAELTEFTLRDDAALDVDVLRVDNAPGLRDALSGFDPHLVLSDLNLPGFSGDEALDMVRAFRPELPVVVLTGALLAGQVPPPADALVLKDEPERIAEVARKLLKV